MRKRKKYGIHIALALLLTCATPLLPSQFLPEQKIEMTASAKTLTKKQAKKKLITYLKKKKLYNDHYFLSYDHMEGKKYVFQYYESLDTHIHTINWYYVHKQTGKITALFDF